MNRPEKIDLFDLSDKILQKLNCEGKFKLSHYDFSLKFRREIDYPSDKFNIHLILFSQELAVSYYTTEYNTIDKIIQILFVHLLDDLGFETIEDAITSTKRNNLNEIYMETINEINSILISNGLVNFHIMIDEQYPYRKVDEKGLPIHELNIFTEDKKMDIKIEVNNNYSGFNEKKEIIEKLKSELKIA
ncbi:MAG: hypothetical protein V4622_05535 [Bacteroidota bacterium]